MVLSPFPIPVAVWKLPRRDKSVTLVCVECHFNCHQIPRQHGDQFTRITKFGFGIVKSA